jgi:hypothetical protein
MADKTCINCIDYKHCLARMNLIFINTDDKGLKELYKYMAQKCKVYIGSDEI